MGKENQNQRRIGLVFNRKRDDTTEVEEDHVLPLLELEQQHNKDERFQGNEVVTFQGIELLQRDPGLLPQIWQYPPEQRDTVRRAYLMLGPMQPRLQNYKPSRNQGINAASSIVGLEFSPGSNEQTITMGVYVRDLLVGKNYFQTPLPEVPSFCLEKIMEKLKIHNLPRIQSRITQDLGTTQCPPSVLESGKSHHTESSRSDRDRHRYSVREQGRQSHDNRHHDYHRSSYSKRDAERRGGERSDMGGVYDRKERLSGSSRSRSRSRGSRRTRSPRRGGERGYWAYDRKERLSGSSRRRSRSRSSRRGGERSYWVHD